MTCDRDQKTAEMSRRTALAAGIAIFAATLFLTPGCFKDTTTAPPCDGFGGGNIVGKWKFRSPVTLVMDFETKEYRPDGTYRDQILDQEPHEGTYEVDGNLVRTQHRTGSGGTARGERCFDVQGSVLKERDKNAGKEIQTSVYDRT